MKKSKLQRFTYIIYALLIVGAIITLYIVFRKIDSPFSFEFVVGYMIFLFLSAIYFAVITILNMRKLKWIDIRKRLIKFIALFIIFSAVGYIARHGFKPSKIDLLSELATPFGLSLGIAFSDLMFPRNRS